MKLFPRNANFQPTGIKNDDRAEVNKLKSTYKFNFDTGEFDKKPNGYVDKVDLLEAYQQWCEKAIRTKRFKRFAYSDKYGNEVYTLIGSGISIAAKELEIERMIREALMVHPLTKAVQDFQFSWEDNFATVYVTYTAVTFVDELITNTTQIGGI